MVRVGKVFHIVRLKEAFEGDRLDFWIFAVIQLLFQIGLAVGAVILIKPGSHKVSAREKKKNEKLFPEHVQCEVGENVRWVLLERRLHFAVEIVQRAQALEARALSIDIGKVLSNIADASAVTQDYISS